MPLVNGTGNSPSPGRLTPRVVKQDKSSGGSVDTTKTRSDPQRVRMSGGERPIGAAKGNQPNTEALCQPPTPLLFQYIHGTGSMFLGLWGEGGGRTYGALAVYRGGGGVDAASQRLVCTGVSTQSCVPLGLGTRIARRRQQHRVPAAPGRRPLVLPMADVPTHAHHPPLMAVAALHTGTRVQTWTCTQGIWGSRVFRGRGVGGWDDRALENWKGAQLTGL